MKNPCFLFKIALLVVALVCFCSPLQAGLETQTAKFTGTSIAFNASTVLRVQDDQYAYMFNNAALWPFQFSNQSVSNRISLHYDESKRTFYSSNWSLSLPLEVKTYNWNGTLLSTEACTLQVNYHPLQGTKYQDKDVYEASTPGYRTEVRLTAAPTLVGLSSIPDDVRLESEVITERYYTYNATSTPSLNYSLDPAAQTITFYWDYQKGAEEYELEWLFVSAYDTYEQANPDYSRAVRINTSMQSYTLNNFFEDGFLLARVRGVGRQGAAFAYRLEGAWGYASQQAVVNPYPTINWTYGAGFAEDGKRKEVLGFYDKSLHSRQVVTLNNTDNVALYAETYYDYEGRGVIQSLPAPDANYSSTLSLKGVSYESSSGLAYNRTMYDNSSLLVAGCVQQAPGMKDNQGASRYYSDQNTRKTQGSYASIPDAQDFPFVQTVYDRQSRVKQQGAAGPTHRVGNGHDTRVYFASATQDRLDRLFGNEAGYAEHYSMQAVQDANGQLSVSYYDLSGRVVATALAGNAPASMDALTSNVSTNFTEHFDTQNRWDPANLAMVSQTRFLVTQTSTPYTFTYALTAAQYDALCNNAAGNCEYELIITIYDDCGNPIADNANPHVVHTNYLINGSNLTKIFSVNFPALGTYTIRKELRLSQAGLTAALTNYRNNLVNDNCVHTLAWWQSQFSINTDCNDCSTYCTQEADAQSLTGQARTDFIANCLAVACSLQVDAPDCEPMVEVMRSDLSPGGQYWDDAPGGFLSTISSQPGFSWAVVNDSLNALCPAGAPYAFGSWSQITAAWQDCFALYFDKYHPEFCHYRWCQQTSAGHQYTAQLIGQTTLAWASNHPSTADPYYNASASGTTPKYVKKVLDSDPYFTGSGVGTGQYTAMQNKMDVYEAPSTSMWDKAGQMVNCTTACDAQWLMFMQLYIAEKTKLEKQQRETGSSCYSLLDIDMNQVADPVSCNPLVQPNCNPTTTHGKQIRFPDYTDLLASATTQTAVDNLINTLTNVYPSPCKAAASNVYTVSSGTFVLTAPNSAFSITAGAVNILGTNLVLPTGTYTAADLVNYLVNTINTTITIPDYTASINPNNALQFTVYAEANLGAAGNTSSSTSAPAGVTLTGATNFTGGQNAVPCPELAHCFCTTILQMQSLWNTTDPQTQQPYINHATYNNNLNTYIIAHLQQLYNYTATATQVAEWLLNCTANPDDPTTRPQNGQQNPPPVTPVPPALDCNNPPVDCDEDAPQINAYWAQQMYEQELETAEQAFIAQYIQQCFSTPYTEAFKVDYTAKEYHYMLYYYDQAGSLVRTVPPNAVQPLSAIQVQQVQDYRNGLNPNPLYPNHKRPGNSLVTNYAYNSLMQVVEAQTPDGGTSRFWYDELGRLVASQNAKQINQNSGRTYSYTLFDAQGRPTEVGEAVISVPLVPTLNVNYSIFAAQVAAGTRTQVSRTTYDATLNATIDAQFTNGQQFLRKRVSSISIEEIDDNNPNTYDHATHFSYDVHGNVNELLQDNPTLTALGQQYKKVSYAYDLVSGNVNEVSYQNGWRDQYVHQYRYDADNRLTHVFTTTDKRIYDQDATYFYHLHGPSSRMELGEVNVQGLDYAYTINGWIKGVNANIIGQAGDLGHDGHAVNATNFLPSRSGVHSQVAEDAFGYVLGYYRNATEQDYTPINASATSLYENGAQTLTNTSADLYNGNIKEMHVALTKYTANGLPTPLAVMYNSYKYDQLNRIKAHNAFTGASTTIYTAHTNTNEHKNTFTYDANGNILTQTRNGSSAAGLAMDNLTYNYIAGTNQLSSVADAVGNAAYADDLDNQAANNYGYDELGQLVRDDKEEIATIEWTVYGKIKRITRTSASTKPDLEFKYDAMGQRILKLVKPKASAGVYKEQKDWSYTYYVRDASGNVMGVYKRSFTPNVGNTEVTDALELEESQIYGSSRLGIDLRKGEGILSSVTYTLFGTQNGEYQKGQVVVSSSLPGSVIRQWNRKLGYKNYELSNHLGNVLVTISDRKLPVQGNPLTLVGKYLADVVATNDYSAFGAPMVGRGFNSPSYRYGFNGQEKDSELGEGVTTAEFWEYDSRLGRRWNIDPEPIKTFSDYSCFGDNPIKYSDIKGNAWWKDENGNIVWIEGGKSGETRVINNIKYTYSSAILSPSDLPTKNATVMYVYFGAIHKLYSTSESYNALGNYSYGTGIIYNDGLYPSPENGDRRVNQGTDFIANENVTPENFYDVMMSDFMMGAGPENWYFGEDHAVSKNLLNSLQVQDGLNQYYTEMKKQGVKQLSDLQSLDITSQQALSELPDFVVRGMYLEGTAKTVEHFIGSVRINITPDFSNNTLIITVFNVTSLGSGSFPGQKSYIRPTEFADTDTQRQPFTNISQTFVIRVPMNAALLQ
jgi:YD repeat-containing protein